MIISNKIKLPVKVCESVFYIDLYHILDSNSLTMCETKDRYKAKVIAHAINHHKELVETLSDFVADSDAPFDRRGDCMLCTETQSDGHDSNCPFEKAVKLLEKINNE